MTISLSKKHLGFLLGAAMAISVGIVAFAGIHDVSAQTTGALTAEDLFGGSDTTGVTFASTAGLGSADLTTSIAQIIRILLGFLGVIAVCIILWGGFKYMTAGGKEEDVKKATKLIYSGIIGLVIIIASYAIASFVIESIISATSGTTTSTTTSQ